MSKEQEVEIIEETPTTPTDDADTTTEKKKTKSNQPHTSGSFRHCNNQHRQVYNNNTQLQAICTAVML